MDCKGKIAVVHNGIIENYYSLKEKLIKEKHIFKSNTDTEVIAHLVEKYMKGNLFEAVRKAVQELEGSYAIAVISEDEPDRIVAVRKGSPLVIGLGKDENLLASDIPAMLGHTRKMVILSDGDMAVLTREKVEIFNEKGERIEREITTIPWDLEELDRGEYPHFMLKEIHEQPQALSQTLAGIHDDIAKVLPIVTKAEKVIIVGAGTSYHASLLGSLLLNNIGGIWSHAIISSEALWYVRSITDRDVVIAVSQSGETIDTLLAVREAKKRGALVIALSNVVDSAIPRESDLTIYTKAGPEIGVAATKTFTTQVATLSYLAIKVGQAKGLLKEGEANEMIQWLKRTPDLVSRVISVHEARVRSLARRLMNKQSAFYLGRGIGLPVSMEGALKLKEVAYIHAEAYPAGESKHGPIALVEEEFPVIFTILGRIDAELLKSNIEEMNARYAWTIGVVPKNIEELIKLLKEPIKMPVMNEYIAPIVYIVPYQLLAYYTAVTRGYDPDKPRNLAKTVTVV